MSSLDASLDPNKRRFQELFSNCFDFVIHDIVIGEQFLPACVMFIHAIADEKAINESVLNSLSGMKIGLNDEMSLQEKIKLLVSNCDVRETSSIHTILEEILQGNAVLLVENFTVGLIFGSKGFKTRNISEPLTEGTVKGPKEGFTESISTNVSLLRRRIKTHRFKLEQYVLGQVTKTAVCIAYLEGTVSEDIVLEVKKRIERINIDSVLESEILKELIEDEPYTLFPQIETTERPDKVAASIIEGRVGIIVDGTPFAMIVPAVLIQFLQSSEDYYQRYPFSIFIRGLRIIATGISLLLPSLYISVTTYHQELLPSQLMVSIMNSYENVPFPVSIEAFLMELAFELLQEAGVRLPRQVGQAISIVGALVIGQAAVQAGLVSPSMVIIVATTGIASFTIPNYSLAISLRLSRLLMMVLAGFLGLYGVMLGLLVLLIHLSGIRSFGIPYLAPLAPTIPDDMKDVILRVPVWKMTRLPRLFNAKNRRRAKNHLKPDPSK